MLGIDIPLSFKIAFPANFKSVVAPHKFNSPVRFPVEFVTLSFPNEERKETSSPFNVKSKLRFGLSSGTKIVPVPTNMDNCSLTNEVVN